MKRLLILGSTGSIGTQALDVVGDEFEIVGRRRRRAGGGALDGG
jgi:1-deoxy-D-xylulose 5-phosphate reductoisomerase